LIPSTRTRESGRHLALGSLLGFMHQVSTVGVAWLSVREPTDVDAVIRSAVCPAEAGTVIANGQEWIRVVEKRQAALQDH